MTTLPRSSILRTIPVAFIYKNSFVDLITLLLSVNKGVLYLLLILSYKITLLNVSRNESKISYSTERFIILLYSIKKYWLVNHKCDFLPHLSIAHFIWKNTGIIELFKEVPRMERKTVNYP